MTLSYSKSCLIGAIMESIAYGLYFTYFLQSVRILRRKLVAGRVSLLLTITTLVLFVLITMRLVLDNKAAVEAFTDDPLTPNAAEIYFTSFGNGALFRTGTYIALTVVSDIFIVYRVFVVWAHNYFITAVPFLLAIADVVSGGLVLQAIHNLAAGASPDGDSLATHIMIFYGFTLGLNVISTLLIALRIWLTQRQAAKANVAPSDTLNLTMTIVIESAVLYSVCLIVMIIPTATGSNVQYCMLSVMPGIVGIAFSLIIVRAGSGQGPHTTWALPAPGSAAPAKSSIHFVPGPHPTSQFTQTSGTMMTSTGTDFTHSIVENSGIQVHLQSGSGRSAGTSTRSDFELKDETEMVDPSPQADIVDLEKQA